MICGFCEELPDLRVVNFFRDRKGESIIIRL